MLQHRVKDFHHPCTQLEKNSIEIHGHDITFELLPKTTMPRLMWRGEGGLKREPGVSSPEEKEGDKEMEENEDKKD